MQNKPKLQALPCVDLGDAAEARLLECALPCGGVYPVLFLGFRVRQWVRACLMMSIVITYLIISADVHEYINTCTREINKALEVSLCRLSMHKVSKPIR